MSEKNRPEDKSKGKIVIDRKTIDGILNLIVGYYPMIKVGAKWVGIDIPPEIDEIITARQKGEDVDLTKLQNAMSKVEARVGEPVMTRALAEEAHFLHYREHMGTRQIADYFTNERGSPCSHATVARWINMIDMEKSVSKMAFLIRVAKYGVIAGLIALSAYISHLVW
ncbi:hypothetical protein ES708_11375 [subsurface metagenome]